ncbi:MAG: type VI secretion system tube protein Hcp [Deltaproteobacteria bacterium]|nr:type VI secretion system tube protein Hcp [Candidatus Tharpella aukensis]
MAVDILLEIEGVDGESKISGYEDKIDVLSWTWGMSNSGDMHSGGGGGSGKVDVQDLTLTKYVDKSTVALTKNCCMGKHFATAKMVVRKSGGDSPVEYLVLELKKVLVTGIQSGGGQGDDRIMEDITLNFAEFKFTYNLQSDDGSVASTIPIGWSMETNQEV